MVWQRSGTVAVQNGSSTVIGTNVDFAASSRIGDSFIGPDGVNYELANVASSTVISILPAYKGATASGAAYAIMPVQGYDKMLSDAFNNLNNQFGPKLAALGTTGNYDILPVLKGGTGNTVSLKTGAYSDLVGSASSGAIFETGTNANGSYVRFADGTQICFGVVSRSCAATNALGSLFYGYANSITFPAGFVGVPAFSCQSFSAGVITWDGSGGSTASIGVPLIISTASLAARTYTCNYIALGKWK